MISLYNDDCNNIIKQLIKNYISVDVIYADVIYDSMNFSWFPLAYELLKDNGIFYLQTDDSTVAEWKIYLDSIFGKSNWLDTIITVQEWGGTSKRFFPRKHDYILFYSKGKDYKFYPERIQIPKVTAGTDFDKKGTGLKTPCDVFYDLGNFSTTSKERIKGNDGKNIRWQKPIKLFNRILGVCTNEGDLVLDPFLGSGTTGVWCKINNRNFIGIEKDKNIFSIAKKRIDLA